MSNMDFNKISLDTIAGSLRYAMGIETPMYADACDILKDTSCVLDISSSNQLEQIGHKTAERILRISD